MTGKLTLHPKVAGGTLSAGVAMIVLWVLSYWIKVPVEVGAAFTLVLSFAGGWLSPAGITELVAGYGKFFSPAAAPSMELVSALAEPVLAPAPVAPAPPAPAPPAPAPPPPPAV